MVVFSLAIIRAGYVSLRGVVLGSEKSFGYKCILSEEKDCLTIMKDW